MSTVPSPSTQSNPIPYQPRPLDQPKVPWSQRINWRIIIFVGVVALPIALLFFWWLNEFLSGGIHDYGAYKEVDLKAMSTFDMDQMNAKPSDIPSKWRELDGKKVVMIGEMWAPRASAGNEGLDYFQLVYSKTKCCFSGPPLAQHFVDGNVVKGKHVYYDDSDPVKVVGTIHVSIRKDDGGVIKSIYHVDVEDVTPIQN